VRKSTRALVGMILLDFLLLVGTGWMVLQIRTGAWDTSVSPQEAIATITSVAGAVIGVVSAVLVMAFVRYRKKGN
jgi:heme/copper-type cytochrome/quinol oxidase subunit 2